MSCCQTSAAVQFRYSCSSFKLRDDGVWLMILFILFFLNDYYFSISRRFWSAVGWCVVIVVVGNGRRQWQWHGHRWAADSGRHRLGGRRRGRFGAHVRHHLLLQIGATHSGQEGGRGRWCGTSSTSSSSSAGDQGSQPDGSLFAPWRRSSATTSHATAPAARIRTDSSSIPTATAQLHALFGKSGRGFTTCSLDHLANEFRTRLIVWLILKMQRHLWRCEIIAGRTDRPTFVLFFLLEAVILLNLRDGIIYLVLLYIIARFCRGKTKK